MSAITDAFPALTGAEEGDQIYLRAGHTTAQLQVQVRRGQEVWQGELAEEGWRLYPVGGRVLGQPYGTVRRGQDGRLWIKLTGLQILPLAPPGVAPRKRGYRLGDSPPTGAVCKSCRAPITWLRTASGAIIPVNRSEHAPEPSGPFDPEAHTSHFATCPNATEHRRRGPSPERVEVARETIAARRLDPAMVPPQPVREQGWPERVRVVRTIEDALGLVEELGERVPSASTRLAVQDLLVRRLVEGAGALLQAAGAEGLRRLGELVPHLEQGPATTLVRCIGARQLELDRPPAYQGGEERLDQ